MTPARRRALLLDLMAGIGLAGPAIMAALSAATRPPWMTLASATAVLLALAAWILWRRSGERSRTAAVAFALVTVVVLVFGTGTMTFSIIWVACLMLAMTVSGRATIVYATALCGMALALHLSSGTPTAAAAGEATVTAVIAALATVVAFVVRDRDRANAELSATLDRLEQANAELQRRLSTEQDLVLARERERTARELHDGLGHRLTAIGFAIEYAGRVDDPELARAELVHARAEVSDALDAMRRTVRAMHPVELGELRGARAFLAVADAFRATGLEIDVVVDEDRLHRLDRERSLLLLRFVQEGLTNVVRHADARGVDISIARAPDAVAGSILDHGGRAPRPPVEGFGLRSLRARAESLGGRLEAESTPTGFALRITLPVADDELAA